MTEFDDGYRNGTRWIKEDLIPSGWARGKGRVKEAIRAINELPTRWILDWEHGFYSALLDSVGC